MAEGGADAGQSSNEQPLGLRAVLIGATGAVGQCLLGELLSSKVCPCGNNLHQTIEYSTISNIYLTLVSILSVYLFMA